MCHRALLSEQAYNILEELIRTERIDYIITPLMSTVIHEKKIDWDNLKIVKNKSFTPLINDSQNSPMNLQQMEEVLENVESDPNFKEKMSHRIFDKIEQ